MFLRLPENMHAISVRGKEFVAKNGLVEMDINLSAQEMELLSSQKIVVEAPPPDVRLSVRAEAEVVHPDPVDEATPAAGDQQE